MKDEYVVVLVNEKKRVDEVEKKIKMNDNKFKEVEKKVKDYVIEFEKV